MGTSSFTLKKIQIPLERGASDVEQDGAPATALGQFTPARGSECTPPVFQGQQCFIRRDSGSAADWLTAIITKHTVHYFISQPLPTLKSERDRQTPKDTSSDP